MALLDVRDVSVSFGGVRALNCVTFTVGEGQIFSVIGPNGAGKTTLYNVISGLTTPNNGEVHLAGERIDGLPPAQRAHRGLQRTFQNLQTLESMTSLENVMVGSHLRQTSGFMAALAGLRSVDDETRQAADDALGLLAQLGLERIKNQDAGTLSYGIQKRLEIARALAARPKILLLDEPAAGLNSEETAAIGDFIQKIAREHVTVVLVEHDMKLVMGISDRVLVLNFGQTLACGSPNEVSNDQRVVEAYLGVDVASGTDDATQD